MTADKIASLKLWLSANAVWLVPLALAVLANVANGVRKHYAERKGLVRFLDFLVDVVSVTTRADAPGTLKLPLTRSTPPEQAPTPGLLRMPPRQDDQS